MDVVSANRSAYDQAVPAYLAYRRAGGESENNRVSLITHVGQAVTANTLHEARDTLVKLSSAAEQGDSLHVLIAKLQSILQGNRDSALAADPELYYKDAAELQLLLESLAPVVPSSSPS
jgi:hypothetical protein